jgi:dihydroorotate dehydrogenase electron transfer subunit
MEIPEVLEIKSVADENKDVKTFFFDKKFKAEPGQFLMVWIPRLDEKPFAVSFENPLGITVEKVGPFTKELLKMKKGDKVGIRGPYGNGFKLKGNRVCLVSGGCGVIPLAFLAEKIKKVKITAIVGAGTKNDLFFVNRLKKHCSKVIFTTDDGSFGEKKFPTDALKDLLKKEKFDCVYTCGPEIMMRKVFEICERHKIECQASLERYMKCGFGLCGQCCIDDIRVCKEGPVLNSKQLRKLTEFGVFERDKSGKKVYF